MGRLSIAWFILSSLVVAWDTGFVLLRPRSMAGGDLYFFWKPYDLYIAIDKEYGDMENPFVIAQSWLNVVEVVLCLAAATLLLMKNRGGILLGFFVSSLTFWKTLIYFIQYTELCKGSHRLAHVNWNQYILLFLIPNGMWIVVPFLLILSFGRQLLQSIASHKEKTN